MKNNKFLYFMFLSVFIHGIILYIFNNKNQNNFLKERTNLSIIFKQQKLIQENIVEKKQQKIQKEGKYKKEKNNIENIENKNIFTEEKDINVDLFNDYYFNYKKVTFIISQEKTIDLISVDDEQIKDDAFKLYLENKLILINEFPINTEIELLLYPMEKIKLVE